MRTLWQDVRYGVRLLLGSPGFTAVAVATLALGIAVNTAVFSWIDAVLLRPLPGVRDAGQVLAFETTGPNRGAPISYRDFRDYRDHLKLVSGLVVTRQGALSWGEGEHSQRIWGELVSGNFFAVLGIQPFLGRFFSPDEQGDKPGAYPVAVISHRLWRTRFQADPGAIGRTVRVNQRELTVIGVAPPEFGGLSPVQTFDVWALLTMGPQLNVDDNRLLEHRGSRGLVAVARLKPGVSLEQARAEAAALARQLAQANPNTNEGIGATLLPYATSHYGVPAPVRAALQVLMAMCVVVLLIACANVANLLLARATARQKELSIRMALGARPGRVVRQLLTEAFLLAAAGALAALPLALWLGRAISYLIPALGVPTRFGELELNRRVLGFTVLICAGAALAAGLAPALHALRSELVENLQEGGRGSTSGVRSQRMRSVFVVAQVALALVALVGAGLFLRSFQAAKSLQPGFDARNVLVAQFQLSGSGYTAEKLHQFCLRLRERLASAPGVAEVSYAELIPLGLASAGPGHKLQIEGYVPQRGEGMTIDRNLVAPGFLSLLRIPLLEGRDFTERDDQNSAPVMIVNESFARRFFPGRSPIGRKVLDWGMNFAIVGLAKDSKYYRLNEAPLPYFYAPFRQLYALGHGPGSLGVAFYLRTAGNPVAALPALRREVASIDAGAAAFHALPLAEYNGASLFAQRLAASLLSTAGALAMLLAAVGLYSVTAYAVSRRTHEIGIRLALGARPGDVLALVIRQGMTLTAVGLIAGIAAALVVSRLVTGLLINVAATDPTVFAAAALFLVLVTLLACYLPARRATQIQPNVALRHQ